MPPKVIPFYSLRFPNFRYFWIALFLTQMATQMELVAINWHIYHMTKSAVNLGIIGLAGFFPLFFFSMFGGIAADKFNRKKIMLIAQILLAVSACILAITSHYNIINPYFIYAVVVLNALVIAFDLPARQSLIPSLVPGASLVNAVSLSTLNRQTATIIGPVIAGFSIEFLGISNTYFFLIFLFLFSFISLVPMKLIAPIKKSLVTFSLASIKEGIHFVVKSPLIYSTMLLDFFATFFASATVLLPIYAQDILQTGPRSLGFLYAAPSIGGVIAGLFLSSIRMVSHQGLILLGSVIVFGLATIGFGFSTSFFLSLIFLAFIGAGDMVSTIIRNTIRQVITPDPLRGRMVSINMIFFVGGPYLGEAEAGFLAAAVGAPVSVVLGGIGTVLATLTIAAITPKLRKYHGHELKV